MKHQSGQALVFSLLLIPTLLIAVWVLLHAGETAYVHYRTQSHIDRLALDTLQPQAQALEALGKLNPYAQTIIDTRRAIERAQAAGFLFSKWSLEGARQTLLKAQNLISLQQKAIKNIYLSKSYATLRKALPPDLKGKVVLISNPLLFKIHVQDKQAYQGEAGAPQRLSQNFLKSQNVEISAFVKTQKFINENKMKVKSWKKLNPMQVSTFAQIEMSELEGPWKVHIRKKSQDN